MPFIFGYGSLIYPPSISRTLGRIVDYDELYCARLNNYVRTWSASSTIELLSNGESKYYEALFLDLTYRPKHSCNGVAIKVSLEELNKLDIRESGYKRQKVKLFLIDKKQYIEAYTYIIPNSKKIYAGIITAKYKEMIDIALKNYSLDFESEFIKSTTASNAPVIKGEYIFKDPVQNMASGRSLPPTEV